MVKDILWVGAGGAVGSALRYLVWRLIGASGGFPWATLLVNVAGSFVLGLLAGIYAGRVGPTMRLALFFGFLGGFTTFSTFAGETVVLARTGSAALAFGNVAISIVVGLAAAFAGVMLGEQLAAG
ncbi:MAG: CrcB family protein [Acidimicrobiia bacterium]|nr:CrcB family protein [Acidimicrobiia bacterium]